MRSKIRKQFQQIPWRQINSHSFLPPPPRTINAQVVRECRKKNIPVNNASDRDQCDFYFPGIAKDGDTVVGITSGGRDHKLAAKISQAVRNVLHV